jgi:methanogenic corrinoid protein MtbC1
VTAGIRLNDYSTAPLYNIKAVVQATGISPSTLRAWERRYHMCQPQRSESGYRLYSDRDLAIIRWLKTQVDAGMSISQAVAWLESFGHSESQETAVLPHATARLADARHAAGHSSNSVRGFDALGEDLLDALIDFDEARAEEIMAEAFAMYPVEAVGEELVTPVLIEIGERWHRHELSITREHFATGYLLQRLTTLLRTIPNLSSGPTLWIGCAPHEQHEAGPVLLALYLRRAGFQVHYLGQNVPLDDVVSEVSRQQPDMLVFSASTAESAKELQRAANQLDKLEPPRPIFGYGGRAFITQPELRESIVGVYLGDSAYDAVDAIRALVNGRHGSTMQTWEIGHRPP